MNINQVVEDLYGHIGKKGAQIVNISWFWELKTLQKHHFFVLLLNNGVNSKLHILFRKIGAPGRTKFCKKSFNHEILDNFFPIKNELK